MSKFNGEKQRREIYYEIEYRQDEERKRRGLDNDKQIIKHKMN